MVKGYTAWENQKYAHKIAREMKQGSHIAVLDTSKLPVGTVERTGKRRGHYTVYADPVASLDAIDRVEPLETD